jgi:hypothetical protein
MNLGLGEGASEQKSDECCLVNPVLAANSHDWPNVPPVWNKIGRIGEKKLIGQKFAQFKKAQGS